MSLAGTIATKIAEFEELGLCRWKYRKPCRWCAEGYEPIPSSVSDAMVHPDSPVGRVVCAYPKEVFED